MTVPPEIELSAPGGETLPERPLREALGRVLAKAGIGARVLSVTFLGDEAIRDLNIRWLDHDWVPDVLSFAFDPPLLGDVYVGYEQARRQAAEHGVPLDEELVRLAVHGTLHLVGHDHPDDPALRDTSEHFRIQEAVVRAVMGPPPGEGL